MQKYFEPISNVSGQLTIVSCAVTILGKAMDFLNQYGVAFGVIFGFLTLMINWRFKYLHYRLAKEQKTAAVYDE